MSSLIVALAHALEIAPSELTKLPIPAPGNGEMDAAVDAVRRALLVVSYGLPGGQIQPVEVLRGRVTAILGTLCRAEDTPETMQLAGSLAMLRSVIAASDGEPGDVAPTLDFAADLAARTGEGNAYGLDFGPFAVDLFRMDGLLEAGDYDRVAGIAQSTKPEGHDPSQARVLPRFQPAPLQLE